MIQDPLSCKAKIWVRQKQQVLLVCCSDSVHFIETEDHNWSIDYVIIIFSHSCYSFISNYFITWFYGQHKKNFLVFFLHLSNFDSIVRLDWRKENHQNVKKEKKKSVLIKWVPSRLMNTLLEKEANGSIILAVPSSLAKRKNLNRSTYLKKNNFSFQVRKVFSLYWKLGN